MPNSYYLRPGSSNTPETTSPFLSADIYDVFNAFIDDIQRTVTLVYPEKKEECANCYLDTMGTRTRSVSRYKTDGPMPFENGQPCPYCDGKGYKAIETTEDIVTRIYTDPKYWSNKAMSIKLPQGSIELVTKIEYAANIKRAKYLKPKYNGLENVQTEIYYRADEVSSSSWVLNPQKYVSSYWVLNHEKV
jgi:hypothetical protein